MFQVIFQKMTFKSIISLVLAAVLFTLLSLINVTNNLPVQAAVNCPSGTWNGTSCQLYTCPTGGTASGSTCVKNICPNGQEPASSGSCVGSSQMLVYGCGTGDPNTIYRTTHNGFDSSLCTATANRGLFSQVGACGSGFITGGSRNRGGLPYTYDVRSGDGSEPFYDTYFGYGDSADTLLRNRRTNDAFQAMCNDGSRLCPAGQGLAFYAANSNRHLPSAGGPGEFLCASYSIPNSSLPVFFAGGWNYSYRSNSSNNYYPYLKDPSFSPDIINCRSYSQYATGSFDNYVQVIAGADTGGEQSFYCAPTTFTPTVSTTYAATLIFITTGITYTPEAGQVVINSCNDSTPATGTEITCEITGSGAPTGTVYGGSVIISINNGGGQANCTFAGPATTTCNLLAVGSSTGSKVVSTNQGGSFNINAVPPLPSGSITFEKYYLNGTQEVKSLTTSPGDYITVRIKYNNTNAFSAKNVVINDVLPNTKFSYIPGSLKNCLIDDSTCLPIADSLFNGINFKSTVSTGFYGYPTNAFTGNFELGRLKYIHAVTCTQPSGAKEVFIQSIDNSSIFVPNCTPISASAVADYSNVALLGKRYLHQTTCFQANGEKEIFTQSIDNISSFTPSCASIAGSTLNSSSTLDFLGKRYLHQTTCLQANGEKEIFTQSIDNISSFTPSCGEVSLSATVSSSSTIDLFDSANAKGYIQYQMKSNIFEQYTSSLNIDLGDYTSSVRSTSTSFLTVTDSTINNISLKVFCDSISPSPGERNISLSDAELRAGQDFRCNYQSSICPSVFEDLNANGIKDLNESNITNVLIQLQSTDGLTTYSTITTNTLTQCFNKLLHGRNYRINIPNPPTGSSTTGGNFKNELINYRSTQSQILFGYGTGSLYLNTPSAVTLPSLTVSTVETETSANINSIQVIDTRLSNPGWTLTATVNNFRSVLAMEALDIPIAGKFKSRPGTVTINSGQTQGIGIGDQKITTSVLDQMSIFSGNPGSSKGDFSINNNVTLTVPAYIKATSYTTDYVFTII